MPDLVVADRASPYPLTAYWRDPTTGALIPYMRLDPTASAGMDAKGPAIVMASFARPANTTAYASGQLIANSTAAGSVTPLLFAAARAADAATRFVRFRASVDDAAWQGKTINLHLFRTLVAPAVGDGGALAASLTIASLRVGIVPITLSDVLADGAQGSAAASLVGDLTALPVTGTVNFYGLLEATGAVTPAASKTFAVTAELWRG